MKPQYGQCLGTKVNIRNPCIPWISSFSAWLTIWCYWTVLFSLNSSDSILISYIAPQPPEINVIWKCFCYCYSSHSYLCPWIGTTQSKEGLNVIMQQKAAKIVRQSWLTIWPCLPLAGCLNPKCALPSAKHLYLVPSTTASRQER